LALGHAVGQSLGRRGLGSSDQVGNRIARVLFATAGQTMVLLHGFIKKLQKTPGPDLVLAKDRLKLLKKR